MKLYGQNSTQHTDTQTHTSFQILLCLGSLPHFHTYCNSVTFSILMTHVPEHVCMCTVHCFALKECPIQQHIRAIRAPRTEL